MAIVGNGTPNGRERQVIHNIRYAILGCGRLGTVVARQLRSLGSDLIILEKNQDSVNRLLEEGFTVIAADIREENTVEQLSLETLTGVLILANDLPSNIKALRMIREHAPDLFVAVRSEDEEEDAELRSLTPDHIIRPLQRAAVSLSEELISMERKTRAQELMRALKEIREKQKVAIVLQDTPDPDSIACGLALQEILAAFRVQSDLVARGKVSHEENRAMVNLLNVNIQIYSLELIQKYDHIALVDTAIAGENNPLPEDIPVFIAIDHHATNLEGCAARFADIRPDLGAASTILVEYLVEMDIPISPNLATALLYGIRSDTDGFRRNFTPQDFQAAARLYRIANPALLKQIESPARSWETVDVLGNAIKNKRIHGTYLFTNVGFTSDKDALGQAADYLIKTEGITTALVFGIINERIQLSARNNDIRINVGKVLEEAYGAVGSAGGHRAMAGGQIPLGVFADIKDKNSLVQMVSDAIIGRFLAAVGTEQKPAGKPGEPNSFE